MQNSNRIPLFESQRTESSVFVVYGKYMENHAMLEPNDKHILFLEYSSSSGEILLSFLDRN